MENRNKVNMLLALGWNNDRIASALGITAPSLRKHYFSELKARLIARDRLDARVVMVLWSQVEAGNVAAIKEFRKVVERNDLMDAQQKFTGQGAQSAAPAAKAPSAAKLGKKEQSAIDAQAVTESPEWGHLLTGQPHKATIN